MIQVRTSPRPSSSPGTIPARKRLVIEVLVTTPKTTREMDGGMMGAMMPPAAIRPAE
jgi:hypothetical protein